MKGELNFFVIWENTRKNTDEILQNIGKKFEIHEVYEITWDPKKFTKNLRRFYGANLPNPIRKTAECGTGPFLLVLVIDNEPKYDMRRTSNGMQSVNINIYDGKVNFRRMLGVGYPIHSAIHQKEVNHDLTLLLNENKEDIILKLPNRWDGTLKKIDTDLVGTNGWENLNELLYVLNSTTNYVILRNFEQFPDKFNSKEHEDLDILTDDMFQIQYILDQRNFAGNNVKDNPTLKIDNKKILFDVKYVSGRYYDEKWSRDILDRRILSSKGFYIPCVKDHFYSLLYHMIIHKSKLSDNYIDRLVILADKLHLNIQKDTFSNLDMLKEILDEFLKEMGYKYTDSYRYKIKHNEIIRLYKVATFTAKNEGMNTLIRAIKQKIKKITRGENYN
mgnify:CR=1 FL=1